MQNKPYRRIVYFPFSLCLAMHALVYTGLAILPSVLFSLVSVPVEKRRTSQQVVLTTLLIANLLIPLHYAGTHSLFCMMMTAVWAWMNGLKMAVWLYCMPQEERRKRPYFGTLWYWRERKKQPPQTTTTKQQQQTRAQTPDIIDSKNEAPLPPLSKSISLSSYIHTYLQHQILFDTLYLFISFLDSKQSIDFFESTVAWLLRMPTSFPSITNIVSSFWLCILFSIYLQFQLQVTYDAFMIGYGVLYHIMPYLGLPQRWAQIIKTYIEEAADMPPAFDSPWEATSLRDYWSNRWHQFYNTCFYRLAYVPLRRLCGSSKILRRTVPIWSVFALSGIMHEYFLYCSAGPALYFGSKAGGWQLLFFLLQPIGIQIGDSFPSGWPGRMWAISWMVLVSHLFVIPYLLCNYFTITRLQLLPLLITMFQ